jgi:hypothetical protein
VGRNLPALFIWFLKQRLIYNGHSINGVARGSLILETWSEAVTSSRSHPVASDSAEIPTRVPLAGRAFWAGPQPEVRTSSGSAAGVSVCTGWGKEGQSPPSPSAFRIPACGPMGPGPLPSPAVQPPGRRLGVRVDRDPLDRTRAPSPRLPSAPKAAEPHRAQPAQAPPHFPIRRPAPRAALHTWRSLRPRAFIGQKLAAWGAGRAGAGRGRKVAAARRWGRGALTRMFTPGHPGKWKRRALLRGGEPQSPVPGPPPPPPPW